MPNVVFPCATLHDSATGRIALYYGAADSYVGIAFTTLDVVTDYIVKHKVYRRTIPNLASGKLGANSLPHLQEEPMADRKHIKMSDIAKELGISTVAVSKALSGQKGVSEELRARIRGLAGDMGYQSPAELRKNRQAAGSSIGVLIPKRYLDSHETFYWKLYQEVVGLAKQKECFTLLEVLDEGEAMRHNLPKLAQENRADGIIIIGKPINGYAAMLRERWPHPVVFLDFYDADISADSVISNGFFGAYMLTNHLLSLGHREIGYVGTLLSTASITDRYLGYTKALMEQLIPVRPDWVVDDRNAEGMDIEIRLPSPMPTAFVCNCDHAAALLIRKLRESGYRVPRGYLRGRL